MTPYIFLAKHPQFLNRLLTLHLILSSNSFTSEPSEAGGSIPIAPPPFTKNRAKLVNNRQILAEIWFLTPHFWALTPHFSVASEGPEKD